MAAKDMIAAIDEEIGRLQLARKLLADGEETSKAAPVAKGAKKKQVAKPVKTRRPLSPEARERIAAAQRNRWAASKKAAKKAAK